MGELDVFFFLLHHSHSISTLLHRTTTALHWLKLLINISFVNRYGSKIVEWKTKGNASQWPGRTPPFIATLPSPRLFYRPLHHLWDFPMVILPLPSYLPSITLNYYPPATPTPTLLTQDIPTSHRPHLPLSTQTTTCGPRTKISI